MTVPELEVLLRRKSVPPDAYRLQDGGADESWVLDRDGREWVVYYAERGLRTDERRFASEDEACVDLLGRLIDSFRLPEDDEGPTPIDGPYSQVDGHE